MKTNIILYLISIYYLSICAIIFWKRYKNQPLPFPYLFYILLLIPSLLLILFGVISGKNELPEYKVMIHGYRIPFDNNLKKQKRFSIGSDASDTIQFHHEYNKEELIEPRLLKVSFSNSTTKILLTEQKIKNIVTVNGLPIRSFELNPDVTHKITFAKYKYSDKFALEVEVKNKKPVFRFKGKEFKAGFSREFLFGYASLPMQDKKIRHLGWNERINLPEFKGLFKQSALYWFNDKVWLAAGDAQIKLDGKKFPTKKEVNSDKCEVSIYSRQLGKGRWSVSFNIKPPVEKSSAYLQLIHNSKKSYLFYSTNIKRVALTSGESPFRNTFDVFDFNFPKTGYIIKKERKHFVFRGTEIKIGKLYSCGNTVFSIDNLRSKNLSTAAIFGILFLLSALFFPPNTIRKEPLIGVIISAAIFILSFRQLLAFRAWQGPPYNFNVFIDSAISPYLFMLTIIIISEYYPVVDLIKLYSIKIWNSFFIGRKFKVSKKIILNKDFGILITCIIGYGALMYFFFKTLINIDFIVVAGLLSLFLFVNFYDWIDLEIRDSLLTDSRNILVIFLIIIGISIVCAPLLGGREVIAIIPGRPRPDIIIQITLIFLVAYLAEYLRRVYSRKIINLGHLLMFFACPLVVCGLQGYLAQDFGFIIFVWPVLLIMIYLSIWYMDKRILKIIGICLIPFVFSIIYYLNPEHSPVESQSFNRILFIFQPDRLKLEYFFDYMAHLPVIWSGTQGILGAGFFHGNIDGSLRNTCVNDHVASVFIQGEFGAVGSLLIMLIYIVICGSAFLFIFKREELKLNKSTSRFYLWLIFGLSLMIFWAAAYMFIANMGFIPLTGKNLPLLGLDSKNDVIRYGILIGFMIRYMRKLKKDT
ncbi:membrane hypothetical protein [Candidatus Magnetomoraceae bacterium gMMP-15]